MKPKLTLNGDRSLRRKLKKLSKNSKGATILVGYTANYAIYVHENVGANFQRPGSQAKFLETPLRENSKKYVGIVAKTIKSGGSFTQGLMLAGLSLQRDSQKLCPVDTGNLRASAFTRKED